MTPLGRFLRKTHLDELPQLWNVIRGEMSLVGPRPERPEFVEQLERVVPDYLHRLAVRPGVTGLAQVQLPPDTDLQSVHRKVTCDLFYIQQMNPLLDLQIILATATKVFGVPCEVSCNFLGVPSRARHPGGPQCVRTGPRDGIALCGRAGLNLLPGGWVAGIVSPAGRERETAGDAPG